MSGRSKRRSWRLVSLLAGLCLPLATISWSSSASAATLPVSISLDSSANPSQFGQDVTYTATLTTSDSGNLDPTDGMEFQDNGNDIVNCGFQLLVATAAGIYTATCDEPTNSLSVGDHAITAIFNGDSTYFPNSGFLPTQTVEQGDTTTTITSPTPGTSITYGNESQLSFDVTVAAAPGGANQSPSGQVNVYSGTPGPDTYLCTAFVNGGGATHQLETAPSTTPH